jgi:hypothetical protein
MNLVERWFALALIAGNDTRRAMPVRAETTPHERTTDHRRLERPNPLGHSEFVILSS